MTGQQTIDWDSIAKVLVEHSAKVAEGDRVAIAMTELHAYPLTLALYRRCVEAGAYPQVQLLSAELKDTVLRHGSSQQVSWVPELEAHTMDWADVYFGLRGAANLYAHHDIAPDVLVAHQAAMGTISAHRWEKTRWCLVRIPDETMAVAARTSATELSTMFARACTIDWDVYSKRWQQLADWLTASHEIALVGEHTHLTFTTRGRRWVVFAGEKNLPDGEIATAPVVESVNGHISFNLPGVLGGRIVEGIRLRWKDGVLTDATAHTNQEYLRRVLDTDEGASLLGEFGIGVNPEINRFSYDILYDEKMIGTVHAAVGRAYPECGGTNQSSIHWDIIHDMRQGDTLYADSQPLDISDWSLAAPTRDHNENG